MGISMETREVRRILVTAIGSFAAPAVIRKLKEEGCYVVGTDVNPAELLSESTEVQAFYQLPRCDAREEYLQKLSAVIQREQIDGILPLTDAELDVLGADTEQLGGALLLAPSGELLQRARHKRQSKEAAEAVFRRAGNERFVTIPTFRMPHRTEEEREQWLLRHMPLILKPDNGRSSEGVFRIGNREALTRALLELRMLGRAEGYLAQPFISGRVVCVDTIRDSAGHTLALAREEYIRTPRGAGLSVQVFRDSELEAICGALAAELGVIGCVNFEFIKDAGGKYHFLECNPRFSGGIGFSERAGLPAVRLHLGAWRGESIPEDITEQITPGWQVKKYIEVVTKE